MWQRAAEGDPIQLARLADREGAGGSCWAWKTAKIGLTALAALPFADDAELAYQRLGEILRQIDPVESGPLVRAITGIALRPRRQTEPQDPEGTRFVGGALFALAERTKLPAALRAPAISALRLLAERGAVDELSNPSRRKVITSIEMLYLET